MIKIFPLISVIIPAYNSASRIKFTLESIISQNWPELEIILIDDASSDDTVKISREVLKSSGRNFTLHIHESNMGVSVSRNDGLNLSHGDFISFIDGDDVIDKNFLSGLYASLKNFHAQISCCNIAKKFSASSMTESFNLPEVSNGEEIIFSRTISPVCCLYEKNFLLEHDLYFHEGCTAGEDVEFQIKALCFAERVSFVDEFLYFYVQHENMGSIRDNNTRNKKLSRYKHNTQAQIRTADFLLKHAKTKRVKFICRKILRPQNLIRQFNIFAAEHNRKNYNLLRQDKENVKILREALNFYTLRKKTEVFAKALTILLFPKIYYALREK